MSETSEYPYSVTPESIRKNGARNLSNLSFEYPKKNALTYTMIMPDETSDTGCRVIGDTTNASRSPFYAEISEL